MEKLISKEDREIIDRSILSYLEDMEEEGEVGRTHAAIFLGGVALRSWRIKRDSDWEDLSYVEWRERVAERLVEVTEGLTKEKLLVLDRGEEV